MAEDILHDDPGRFAGLTLIPGSGGVFEVKLDGNLIFSKKQVGRFPNPSEIKRKIATAGSEPASDRPIDMTSETMPG